MKVLQGTKVNPGKREALSRAMGGEQGGRRGRRGRARGKHKISGVCLGKCFPLEGWYVLSENKRKILVVALLGSSLAGMPCLWHQVLPSQNPASPPGLVCREGKITRPRKVSADSSKMLPCNFSLRAITIFKEILPLCPITFTESLRVP